VDAVATLTTLTLDSSANARPRAWRSPLPLSDTPSERDPKAPQETPGGADTSGVTDASDIRVTLSHRALRNGTARGFL
jgi:hypothetical protein